MLTRTSLAAPLLVALGLTPHLTGCLDTTIVGGEGGGGEGGGDEATVSVGVVTSGTGPSGGSGGASGDATAWLGVDLDPSTLDHVCPFTGCDPSDDRLFLFVDSQGSTCGNPLVHDVSGTGFSLVIGVPPSKQEVGVHVIDESFSIAQEQHVQGESGPSTSSSTGGWGFGSGTLEIFELTETTVRFTTVGLGASVDGVELVAPRCGTTALPPEGIAMAGDALGATGGNAGAQGVTLVVGSELATCGAPLPGSCSGDTWQVAVSLPGDYLTPGTYALSDDRISSSNCAALPKFLGGTIEVLDVDDDALVVRFADVVDHEVELSQELRIDRCP